MCQLYVFVCFHTQLLSIVKRKVWTTAISSIATWKMWHKSDTVDSLYATLQTRQDDSLSLSYTLNIKFNQNKSKSNTVSHVLRICLLLFAVVIYLMVSNKHLIWHKTAKKQMLIGNEMKTESKCWWFHRMDWNIKSVFLYSRPISICRKNLMTHWNIYQPLDAVNINRQ